MITEFNPNFLVYIYSYFFVHMVWMNCPSHVVGIIIFVEAVVVVSGQLTLFWLYKITLNLHILGQQRNRYDIANIAKCQLVHHNNLLK